MDINELHLVRRFLNGVSRYNHREALEYKQDGVWTKLSWKEFGNIVNKVALTLLSKGVQVGERIGIFSSNSPQWTYADLGTALIKACTVPIYATNTAEQASYIINDAGVRYLFVGEQTQYNKAMEVLKDCPTLVQVVVFSDEVQISNREKSIHWKDFLLTTFSSELEKELTNRINACDIHDIYTIIYTSGTTGKPKGVLVDYENVAYQFLNHDDRLKVEEGKKSLSFLPFSHVYERAWLAYCLHKGVVVSYLDDTNKVAEALKEVKPHYMCVVPRLLEKIYTKIYEKISKENVLKRFVFSFSTRVGKENLRITRLGKTPNFIYRKFYKLADKLVFQKLKDVLGGNMEMIPCGGAALDRSVGRFFRAIGINIVLGYGMTESTATIACWGNKFHLKSVGSVLPHFDVKIGENDEILIKGGSVTKGYFNNPEENAKSFTADGYFRTGDAGRFDKHGFLYITERIKELMKTSNGKYIAPQQIEGQVGKDSFIEQIAVIADARNYVSALIVPNFEALSDYAKHLNLKYRNYSELVRDNRIVDFFDKRLERLQKELPNYERIKKFTLIVNPFTIERNEMTPTLKLKRKNIYKNYNKEIEAMYS